MPRWRNRNAGGMEARYVFVTTMFRALAVLICVASAGVAVAPGTSAAQDGAGTSSTTTSSTTTAVQPNPAPDPAPTTSTVPQSTTTPGVVAEPVGPPAESAPVVPPKRSELIPPPIDLGSLTQLLGVRQAEAVREAQAAADLANAEELRKVASLTTVLDSALGEVPVLDQQVEVARSNERKAAADLQRAESLQSDLAVESYTMALSGQNATLRSSKELIESMDGFEDFVATLEYSGAAWTSLARGVTSAESDLADAELATEEALDARTQLERRVTEARAAVEAATRTAEDVAGLGSAAVEEASRLGEDLAVGGLGPTVLGEAVLSAEDLAAFSARRAGTSASPSLVELAGYFILEGAAEGVRGDIAWAQSILETGNFGYSGSIVSRSDNNYAGIGACDSCGSGFRYASPQMGARAQMQLLHAYADDNLTTDRLANAPVGRPPERLGVRGCCDTWMELSGVWATGPGYGVKILTIYNEMLAFAAERQRASLEAVAALDAAAALGQPTPDAVPPQG